MVEVSTITHMEATPGASRPPVVLVVDDHEDTRHMSLLVLKSQGFTAVAADMRGGDSLRLLGERLKKGAHGGNMVSPVLIDAEGRTVGLF